LRRITAGKLLILIGLMGSLLTACRAVPPAHTGEVQNQDRPQQNVPTDGFTSSLPTITAETNGLPPQFSGMMLIMSYDHGRAYLATAGNLEPLEISSQDVHFPAPALSPDGSQVAFRDLDGYLNVYDISGQRDTPYPEVFTNGFSRLGWSPDGKEIAFGCPPVPANICAVTLESSEMEQYTNLSNEDGDIFPGDTFAGWSKDGEKMGILYSSSPPPSGGQAYELGTIQILDLGTKIITDVLAEADLPAVERFQHAALSPDGSAFLFSARSGDYYAIYRVNADGTGVTRVTPETSPYDITHPLWSPDGKSFVASAPELGSGQKKSSAFPTIFDLSGEILGQIIVPVGGDAVTWIEGGN
jgi:Tol biopolymer transport system component